MEKMTEKNQPPSSRQRRMEAIRHVKNLKLKTNNVGTNKSSPEPPPPPPSPSTFNKTFHWT